MWWEYSFPDPVLRLRFHTASSGQLTDASKVDIKKQVCNLSTEGVRVRGEKVQALGSMFCRRPGESDKQVC